MLTQSDLERERYEARRKAQLDLNTYLREQREALQKAAKGGKVEMIHFCEQLLNLPQTPTEQLAGRTLDELTRLADELQARVMKPR